MSGDTPRRAPSREAILAVHQFPGEFVIKAFGPGTAGFHDAVVAAAHAEIAAERVQVQVRSTASGARRCVTLTLAPTSTGEPDPTTGTTGTTDTSDTSTTGPEPEPLTVDCEDPPIGAKAAQYSHKPSAAGGAPGYTWAASWRSRARACWRPRWT